MCCCSERLNYDKKERKEKKKKKWVTSTLSIQGDKWNKGNCVRKLQSESSWDQFIFLQHAGSRVIQLTLSFYFITYYIFLSGYLNSNIKTSDLSFGLISACCFSSATSPTHLMLLPKNHQFFSLCIEKPQIMIMRLLPSVLQREKIFLLLEWEAVQRK